MRLLLFTIFAAIMWGQPAKSLLHHTENSFLQISNIYSVNIEDFDNDGKPDIYLVSFRGINRLLQNRGNLQFVDKTIGSGVGGTLNSIGINNLELGGLAFDYDNDGSNDIIVAGWGNTTQLLRNEGNLKFFVIENYIPFPSKYDFNDAVAADINRDGLLDLYFPDEHYNGRLFVNTYRGRYEDVTRQSGIVENGISQGASFADVNGDGLADLYVCNWFYRDGFYLNKGAGKFELLELDLIPLVEHLSSNSVSFADYDNDGDLDLFVACRDYNDFLFRNDCTDTTIVFSDVSERLEANGKEQSYGGTFADFDNDGDLDLWINQIGINRLYINRDNQFILSNGGRYTNYTSDAYSTGSAVSDFDRDFDLDLFVAQKDERCVLLENTHNDRNSALLSLTGYASNRNAYGARIFFYHRDEQSNNDTLYASRSVLSKNGYLSRNETLVHIGFKSGIEKLSATIVFPSGIEIRQANITPGNLYEIKENSLFLRFWYGTTKFMSVSFWRKAFWYVFLSVLVVILANASIVYLGITRYNWSSLYTAIYLFMILSVSLFLYQYLTFMEHLYRLLTLVGVSVFGVMANLVYWEPVYKSGKDRKRYSDILIRLANNLHNQKSKYHMVKYVLNGLTNLRFYAKPNYYFWEPEGGILTDTRNKVTVSAPPSAMQNYARHFDASILPAKVADWFKDVLCIPVFWKKLYGFLVIRKKGNKFNLNDEEYALIESLARQMALSFLYHETLEKEKDYIRKLTHSSVKEEYLNKLEVSHQQLATKNTELSVLLDELKEAQSQLVLSEKMASLGRLIAGITHELNNPISYIYANMHQLEEYLVKIKALAESKNIKSSDKADLYNVLSEVGELLDDSKIGANSVKDLISELRRFSHLDRGAQQSFSIWDSIDTVVKIISPELKGRVEIKKQLTEVPLLHGHPGKINQVLLNVLTNAAQAIEEKGVIEISLSKTDSDIHVHIKDNGKGIGEKELDKVFEPFYTTKDIGEGTGLGLSISQTIIKEHGGQISVSSVQGVGTEVTIRLPLNNENEKGPANAETIAPGR
jgi:signal transduction histidine kinase